MSTTTSTAPLAATAATSTSAAPSKGSSPRNKRTPSSATKRSEQELQAAAAATAAAAALIPAAAQPPSSADQTNMFHFHVSAAPFKMICSSNALSGVVLDYIKEKATKGVNSLLSTRLNRVRDELNKLDAEEAQATRNHAQKLDVLQAKQLATRALIAKLAETPPVDAAGTDSDSSASVPLANVKPGTDRRASAVSTLADAAAEEKKEDGGIKRQQSVKPPSTTSAKKKKGQAEEEPQRTPEEQTLHEVTQALEVAATEHASAMALLSREREVLGAEERQLSVDLTWTRQLLHVGSIVPQPPQPVTRPPSQAAGAIVGVPSASSSATLVPPAKPLSVPTSGTSTPAAALSPQAQKSRKLKSGALSAGDQQSGPQGPQSMAPVGATFLGIDLAAMSAPAAVSGGPSGAAPATGGEERQLLNLRHRPLVYASQFVKPTQTYQVVAVYAQPGEPVDLSKLDGGLDATKLIQVPVAFAQQPTDAAAVAPAAMETRPKTPHKAQAT